MTDLAYIRHPLIERIGVAHGFGTRASSAPLGVLRPVQVHGAEVLRIEHDDRHPSGTAAEADATKLADKKRMQPLHNSWRFRGCFQPRKLFPTLTIAACRSC